MDEELVASSGSFYPMIFAKQSARGMATARIRSVVVALPLAVLPWLLPIGRGAEPAGLLKPASFDCANGRVNLRIEPAVVARGESFMLTCEAVFQENPHDVYNPFLWEGYKLPAQIVILSTDGAIRREVLGEAPDASLVIPLGTQPSQWLSLPSMPTVGREFVVKIGIPSEADESRLGANRAIDLPPGDYFVQAVYNRWLRAGRPLVGPGVASLSETAVRQPSTGETVARMEAPIGASEIVRLTVLPSREARSREVRKAQSNAAITLELAPKKIQSKPGREIHVDVTSANRSDHIAGVFNPFLNLLVPERAMALTVTTEGGADLGDLLVFPDGSRTGASSQEWVILPPGGRASTRFTFRAGEIPRTRFGHGDFLPPGMYSLQLRGYPCLTSCPPRELVGERYTGPPAANSYEAWKATFPADPWSTFPGPEICRSNRLELEIMPRTGN